MNKDTSEPASPCEHPNVGIFSDITLDLERGGRGEQEPQAANMTLRDYFAAKAMVKFVRGVSEQAVAENAYRIADAMLAERDRATKGEG